METATPLKNKQSAHSREFLISPVLQPEFFQPLSLQQAQDYSKERNSQPFDSSIYSNISTVVQVVVNSKEIPRAVLMKAASAVHQDKDARAIVLAILGEERTYLEEQTENNFIDIIKANHSNKSMFESLDRALHFWKVAVGRFEPALFGLVSSDSELYHIIISIPEISVLLSREFLEKVLDDMDFTTESETYTLLELLRENSVDLCLSSLKRNRLLRLWTKKQNIEALIVFLTEVKDTAIMLEEDILAIEVATLIHAFIDKQALLQLD